MKLFRHIAALLISTLTLNALHAQCNNALYAMGYNGIIYSVNTTTAALSAVSGTAPSASTSNAIAYAGGATPAFYFFANSKSGALVFESYVPSTNTFTKLSLAGGPVDTVNAACIAPNYKGYYCLDIHGALYYYNIASGTWTTITTVIKDQTGTDITSMVATYSSGDMAFDGSGNLWLLLANKATSKFGLYEVYAAVPTTTVSSITANQVVAVGASMPDGNDPVGIAFNAVGQMYISTLNLSTFACDLYLWNTPATAPMLVHSLSQVILDLSSCSLPLGVLPIHITRFTASLTPAGDVSLRWQSNQEVGVGNYTVQRSSDEQHWQVIDSITPNGLGTYYSFLDNHPLIGDNYYRVVATNRSGNTFFSQVLLAEQPPGAALRVWPNPTGNLLFINNPFPNAMDVQIFDATGRMVMERRLQPGTSPIVTSSFPSGVFMLRPSNSAFGTSLRFVKTPH